MLVFAPENSDYLDPNNDKDQYNCGYSDKNDIPIDHGYIGICDYPNGSHNIDDFDDLN